MHCVQSLSLSHESLSISLLLYLLVSLHLGLSQTLSLRLTANLLIPLALSTCFSFLAHVHVCMQARLSIRLNFFCVYKVSNVSSNLFRLKGVINESHRRHRDLRKLYIYTYICIYIYLSPGSVYTIQS